MAECVLKPCKDKGGELITLTRKAVDKIIQCSEIRKDGVKAKFLQNDSLQVHSKCRQTYILRPKPPEMEKEPPAKIPRESFDFKALCFLCGRKCVDVSKCRNPAQEKWSLVQKLELIESIRTEANNRHDKWGDEVSVRLSQVIDLVSSDGRYHWHCYQTFQKPGSSRPEKGVATSKGGSSADAKREDAFEKLCDYLEENNECQYDFEELQNIFLRLSPEVEPYTVTHFKRKLIQRYGNSLNFAVLPGKRSVICFSGASTNILSDNWYKNRNCDNEAEEELRLIKTAAAIIRREIKSKSYDYSQFPTIEDICKGGSELVPELLNVLITEIIQPTCTRQTSEKIQRAKQIMERKKTAICHSIIRAARPRSFLSPAQLGTGVLLHRKFGSKVLIDTLCNMGVCVPYQEVLRYERSVTCQENTRIENGYVQFVFDNADYNVHTLDGHNTFHVMGGIACITPKTALQVEENVPRKNVAAQAVENKGLFDLQTYKAPATSGYSKIVATNLASLEDKPSLSYKNGRTLNMFWLSGTWLEGPEECKPGWSGCMEKLYAKEQFQTSAVVPLPFINLAPSNPSTMYTALLQAAKQGASNGQTITMVTFDQPLYAKAREIVAAASHDSPLKSLFIRLGGFHLLMSFLSAIGFIMAGSGLEELYSTVYAKNSVQQMMNGKAYSRVIRALCLVEEALMTVFLKNNETLISVNKDELNNVYSNFKLGNASPEEIAQSTVVKSFVDILENQLRRSNESGRTQKLWIQFIEMVEIVRMFIRAERSGDFLLHLHCVHQMLPIFHASGHFNYAKSAHVYLQDSLELLNTLHQENDLFVNCGYFTIRRTEKFWSGVWSDMTIEQVLMRSLKSIGGLTGGRGITATTIATWINSMPTCSRVCEAMEEFAGVRSLSSEQHVELRDARQKRNSKDLQTFISWIEEHNPFSKSPELSSLSTGVIGDETVNCDKAFEIGAISIKAIENKTFKEIHMKRKFAVKSLASITKSVKINNDMVCVNPNTLLHRMVCTVRSDERLEEIFQFELCAYPPSLFDESGLMRKGKKSSMVTVLVSDSKESSNIDDPVKVSYIIDGGHLLHRVVWQQPATFKQICEQYSDYVCTHYGKATVVFDGYERSNTKDQEHLRRSRSNIVVKVEDSIHVNINQNEFLASAKNKMGLITLLSSHLQHCGCTVLQASGDADLLVVLTAIDEAKKDVQTCVIGDDTDLLVLLTVHAPSGNKLKMVVPKKGNHQEKVYIISDIQQGIGDMKDVLLVTYAFTGCDTVSAVYKKGKIAPYRKVQANNVLREKLLVFNNPKADPSAVADAGNYFLLAMFGAKNTEDLDCLRYQSYLKAIAKQPIHALLKLDALPPTSGASRQHSFRTYHQVQQWLNEDKDPLEWGWKKIGDHLTPITTARPAAPQELLSLIMCTCKDECVRNCECRRSGLNCTSICSNCSGQACDNMDNNNILDDELEEEDNVLEDE